MSFQGSGTGYVTYVIGDEQAVNTPSCAVQVLEEDVAGMLTLNMSFTDRAYGQVQVGISIFNYAPATTTYDDVAYVMIGFVCEQPQGGWVSNTSSSVWCCITQDVATASTSYTGAFNASNLAWIGGGDQDSLAIKFGSYSFNVTTVTPSDDPNNKQGAGTGSITYTVGNAAPLTTVLTASTYNHYENSLLNGITASLKWSDPVQGEIVLLLIIVPFSGSGVYNSTTPNQGVIATLSSSLAGTAGNWANSNANAPAVTIAVTYSEQGASAQWQGTLAAPALVWQGPGTQANLNLDVSALQFTLTLG